MVGTGLSGYARMITSRNMKRLKEFIRSQRLGFALRLLVGTLILLAAIPKLVDIEKNSVFLVYNYYILPIQPVNIARYVGLVIPYLELLIGLGLILGVLTRLSAVGWAVLSLAYFIIKLDIIFIQGRVTPCGCFSGLLPDLLVTQSIWLDVVSIIMCIQIIRVDRGRRSFSAWSLLPQKWQISKLRYVW